MFKQNPQLRGNCIVAIAFLGQLGLVHRAFTLNACAPILFFLMIAALYWTNHRIRSLPQGETLRPRRYLWLVAILVAFATSTALVDTNTDNKLVYLARSTVFATLVGQIVLVATKGIERLELLVLTTITSLLSLVCLDESISLFGQIAESGAAIFLFALLSNVTSSSQSNSTRTASRARAVVLVIVMLIVVLVSRPVAIAMDTWLPTLQLQISGAIIENAIDDGTSLSLVSRYVDTASLNDVVQQFDRDPNAVALRIYAAQPPGYLRGSVFDSYRDGRWLRYRPEKLDGNSQYEMLPTVIRPEPNPESLTLNGAVLDRKRFDTPGSNPFVIDHDARGKTVTLEIENDPRRGTLYFLPLQSSRVDGMGRRVVVNSHGILQSGLDTRHSYFATVHQNAGATTISEGFRDLTLSLPSNIADPIGELASSICRDVAAPRAKAHLISDFLKQNYSYSTKRRAIAKDVDPILNFIKMRHAAHCEYFASSTALLLRSEGVPARYVTGYVVNELSDDADVWLGRNLNAHAWVEAYDDLSSSWFIVESTPGREATAILFEDNQANSNSGATNSNTALGESWFGGQSRLWVLLRTGQWAQVLVELSQLMQWPLIALTVSLLFAMVRGRRHLLGRVYDDYAAEYARILSIADRQMRRLRLYRSKSETIHRFATRIESVDQATSTHTDLANWYREFAALRYRSLPPTKLRTFPKLQRFRFQSLPQTWRPKPDPGENRLGSRNRVSSKETKIAGEGKHVANFRT